MSQPEIVQSGLGDETVVARVDLGGEDELYVTPTRTLVYRAEGLLADESIEEYSHGAERITVSEGRRKAKVTLDYGLDGEQVISVPASRVERALQPIVGGVLRHNGVLGGNESVAQLFRFSELTVVVAGERVVRHIGPEVWDAEFESYHYGDVTDLEFEDGSVNTSVVLTVDGQRERFKTPNKDARAVRSALESTLLSYWEVDSMAELRAVAEPDGSGADAGGSDRSQDVAFGDGPDPLFAGTPEPEEATDDAVPTPESGDTAGSAPGSEAPEGREAATETPGGGVDSIGQSGATDAVDAESPGGETGRSPAPDSRSDPGAPAVDAPPRDGAATGSDTTGATGSEAVAGSSDPGFEGSGFEAAAPEADERILEELAALREVVEQQNSELTAQRELIEQLIEELRRGR